MLRTPLLEMTLARFDAFTLGRRATPARWQPSPPAPHALGASLAADGAAWRFVRMRGDGRATPFTLQLETLDETGGAQSRGGSLALAGFTVAFSPRVLVQGDGGVVLFNGQRDRASAVRGFAVTYRCER